MQHYTETQEPEFEDERAAEQIMLENWEPYMEYQIIRDNQAKQHKDRQYITVHSVSALEARQYSIVHANIENTEENRKKVLELYPVKDWHIEYHNSKINVSFKIKTPEPTHRTM